MKKLIVLLSITALFGLAVQRLFGTTVSSKFNNANNMVQNQVVFGGPSTGSTYHTRALRDLPTPRAAAVHRAPEPAAEVPVAPAVPTEVDAISTFAIDVDTGSYTLARRYLQNGATPDEATVRTEEFINYFRYDYPEPVAGKTAAVLIEGAPNPFTTDARSYLLRIGLHATKGVHKPTHLTFLVDTSGSMGTEDRLPLAKEAILTAARNLGPGDTVAIATYAGSARVVLAPTAARNYDAIRRATEELGAGGGTAMGAGMDLAYRLAVENAGANRVSRVVVLSDGDANIGNTTPDAILADIRRWTEDGVTLSTIGFGMGNYRDQMMERLADAGNGNYQYIDGRDEVQKVFGDELRSMTQVVAKDVKVQVEFDPSLVESWRLVGYENRVMADRDFRNDRADGGELGAGHQVTAIYELKLKPAAIDAPRLGEVRFRYVKPNQSAADEAQFGFGAGNMRHRVGDGSTEFRFQAAVAAFSEKLRGRDGVSWGWIEEVAETATAERPERVEFLQLVRRARSLSPNL